MQPFDCSKLETITFKNTFNLSKVWLRNCAPTGSLAYCLYNTNIKQSNISMVNCTSLDAYFTSSMVQDRHFDFSDKCQSVRMNVVGATKLSFSNTCSLAGVTSQNDLLAPGNVAIPKICVNYILVKEVFEMMLRGIPNYTADSYPMYFESGSTVTDDAAGTLQSLVEQCQAMGWAIYNLTINPYTE